MTLFVRFCSVLDLYGGIDEFVVVIFITRLYGLEVMLSRRRPIKHVLDDVLTNKAGLAQYTINLVKGVTLADPYGAAQSEVNAGSAVVTHIELEVEVWIDTTATQGTVWWDDFFWYIWFNIAGAQTKPTGYSIGTNDLKAQVFAQSWGKNGLGTGLGTNFGSASESVRRFHISLEIPKAYQTINKDDIIQFVIDWPTQAAAIHNCRIQAIFKEYQQV